MKRFSVASVVAALSLAASASSATGSVTIGQTSALATACGFPFDRVQQPVSSGNSYTVPANGTITSWSTSAGGGAGQLTMKVYRSLGGPTYLVVGRDGPRTLAPSTQNTFPASVPVKAGDVLGSGTPSGAGSVNCGFPAPGDSFLLRFGDLADGQSGNFVTPDTDRRLNISAVINPTNSFTRGPVTKNKKKGTATASFNLPNPGELTGSGGGAKVSSALASKTVPAAGPAKLKIRAKGKKLRTLNETGKVIVKPKITYRPTGGDPSTQSLKVTLKKRL